MLSIYLALLETEEEKVRFQWIYDHLRHKMYRVAYALLRSEHLAQEAVQESFFKIIRNFLKISLISSEEITPYIVTIVENTAKDILRKEGRTEGFPEEWDPPAPEDVYGQSEYRRLVELIRAMPGGYRHVLLLKFVEEESDRAIAKRLGLTASQVSNRISRGRKLLQERLRKEGFDREGV